MVPKQYSPESGKCWSSGVTWSHCSVVQGQDTLCFVEAWIQSRPLKYLNPFLLLRNLWTLLNNLDNVCLFIMYGMFASFLCCPWLCVIHWALSLCVSDSFVFAVSTPTFTTVHEYLTSNETAFLYVFVTLIYLTLRWVWCFLMKEWPEYSQKQKVLRHETHTYRMT